jgi:hypothetical protein
VVQELRSGQGRTRTSDPLIRSQSLYPLSYPAMILRNVGASILCLYLTGAHMNQVSADPRPYSVTKKSVSKRSVSKRVGVEEILVGGTSIFYLAETASQAFGDHPPTDRFLGQTIEIGGLN